MRRQRTITSSLLKTTILAYACVFSVSCATPHVEDAPQQHNLLFAEHSAMKKRLPLVERENDVLTKENDHYRAWVRELEGKIKALTTDLTVNREKYAQALAAERERIKNLELSMQQLDEEKSEQIAVLNSAMLAHEQTFLAERKKIIKAKEHQESILSNQLAEKDRALEKKTLEITTLTSAKADLEAALENKALEISTLASAKAALEKEIENKAKEISKLAAANTDTLKRLNETSEMIASLKKSRDKSLAELESAKAANADLVRTFNELFNQLQLKQDQSGTKI